MSSVQLVPEIPTHRDGYSILQRVVESGVGPEGLRRRKRFDCPVCEFQDYWVEFSD